jgi:hypothetical protein
MTDSNPNHLAGRELDSGLIGHPFFIRIKEEAKYAGTRQEAWRIRNDWRQHYG